MWAAALIAKTIKECEVIMYEDLGPEAVRRLRVENFPAIVINDIYKGFVSRGKRKKDWWWCYGNERIPLLKSSDTCN